MDSFRSRGHKEWEDPNPHNFFLLNYLSFSLYILYPVSIKVFQNGSQLCLQWPYIPLFICSLSFSPVGLGWYPIKYLIQIPGEFKENCTFNFPIKCGLTVQCWLLYIWEFQKYFISRRNGVVLFWSDMRQIRSRMSFSTCPSLDIKQHKRAKAKAQIMVKNPPG